MVEFVLIQDLQIYHDGSHSWFKNTTGRLLLQTDGDQIQLRGNTIVAFNGAASTNIFASHQVVKSVSELIIQHSLLIFKQMVLQVMFKNNCHC